MLHIYVFSHSAWRVFQSISKGFAPMFDLSRVLGYSLMWRFMPLLVIPALRSCACCVQIFVICVCQREGNFFLWYIQMNQFQFFFFSPCRLPCAQQAKFILPSICMLSTNLHYWRLQAWMWALILSLRAECMKNEIRFQLAQNNGRFEVFLYAQWAAGVSDGALSEDSGEPTGTASSALFWLQDRYWS